ncbi:class I SAM-dependent methyltransferase [Methylocaldum sp.]|uniref:class I SAM-dependent methyltransferase n=1 Tax=Methylocaldum sp. TaxID=1969727 RepID=UPI00322023CE
MSAVAIIGVAGIVKRPFCTLLCCLPQTWNWRNTGRIYDFVTCTEVAEYFHQPSREFRRLDALLRPGGWLALMTCFQSDDTRFADWHYRRDPTHVVFYREATLRRLAGRHGWHCEIPCPNVALMRKESA